MKQNNGFTDPNDKIAQLTEILSCIFITGALWFFCSLPVITIGASATAAYSVIMRRRENGLRGYFKPFFSEFKANFLKSTAVWLIFIAAYAVLALDFYYYHFSKMGGAIWLKALIVLLFVIVTAAALYCFPLLAGYEIGVKDALVTSFKGVALCPKYTALALFSLSAVIMITAAGFWQFAVIDGGVICYINSVIMQKAFSHTLFNAAGYRKF